MRRGNEDSSKMQSGKDLTLFFKRHNLKFKFLALTATILVFHLLFFPKNLYARTYFVWEKAVRTTDKIACLTLDDGPNGEATEKVLEVLKKHNVSATFFLIGENMERYPDLTKRIVKNGHLIGNHSYAAGHLLFLGSKRSIKENLLKTNRLIYQLTGYEPHYFRPPNGLMTATLEDVIDELSMAVAGVNVFVFDNMMNNSKEIANKVLAQVKGGPLIIVLHDGFGAEKAPSRKVIAEALDIVIPDMEKRGYTFTSIDKCL